MTTKRQPKLDSLVRSGGAVKRPKTGAPKSKRKPFQTFKLKSGLRIAKASKVC